MKTHKNLSLFCDDGISIWKYEKSLPVSITGSIVDIETRGLDSKSFNITAMGFITKNKLFAFVIDPKHEDIRNKDFLSWVRNKVSELPRPLIAYFKTFEEQWLGINFDIEIQPKPYAKKANMIYFSHLPNSDNSTMIRANKLEILYHLIVDLFEELALYSSCSHESRNLTNWYKEMRKLSTQKKD